MGRKKFHTAIGDVYKSIDKKNPSIDTIKETIQMAQAQSVPQKVMVFAYNGSIF